MALNPSNSSSFEHVALKGLMLPPHRNSTPVWFFSPWALAFAASPILGPSSQESYINAIDDEYFFEYKLPNNYILLYIS